MIYNYDDFNIINESLINESFNLDKLKDEIMKLKNKPKVIKYLINKFNLTTNKNIRLKISRILLLIYMMILSNNSTLSLNASQVDLFSKEMSNFKTLTINNIGNIISQISDDHINSMLFNTNSEIFKDPSKLKLSHDGEQHIKNSEQLRLSAYELGDNKVTIGYGHSEPLHKSKYKIGYRITKEEADRLFKKDIEFKIKGVKKMFKEWEKESGKEILLTQSMFDAIISMVYNIGITGFRNTRLSEYLKNGDLLSASEIIKKTKISNNFPGLETRRETEYDLFMKDINNNYSWMIKNKY